MTKAAQIKSELRAHGSAEKAKASAWFFKTGPGQYGEGDLFIGVTVPEQRQVAKKHLDMTVAEVEELLHSPEHEFRLTALMIWVYQFKKADEAGKQDIYRAYLANTKWINNWDLVDSSAVYIVGPYGDMELIRKLALSAVMWERRIAVLACFWPLQYKQPEPALEIATTLLSDKQDLMHKAVGWMLREVGKNCGREVLVDYLAMHNKTMPRTTLRYAIEHFSPEERQKYLKGLV